MGFIKVLRWPLVVSFALLVAACGGGVKEDAEQPEQAPAPVDGEESAEVPLVLIPNPYLLDPPSVSNRAKQEFARATAAMDAKQWKQAEGLLLLMTETYPKLSGPHVNLGICRYHQQNLEGAEAALNSARELNAANMDAYTWLGTLYREQGRFADAEQIYLAALEVWPHHPESHRNLGILYDLYMGRFEQALQHYKLLQQLSTEEDRQVKGWVMDLERRLAR